MITLSERPKPANHVIQKSWSIPSLRRQAENALAGCANEWIAQDPDARQFDLDDIPMHEVG
jgi:hypothetical protein